MSDSTKKTLSVFGGPFDGHRFDDITDHEYVLKPLNSAGVDRAYGEPAMAIKEALRAMEGTINLWSAYVRELRDIGYGFHHVANISGEQWEELTSLDMDEWPAWFAKQHR